MAFCKEQIYVYILNILYDPREKKPVTEGEQWFHPLTPIVK